MAEYEPYRERYLRDAPAVLEPEPFPVCAELVLAQRVLTWELAAGDEVTALFIQSLEAGDSGV